MMKVWFVIVHQGLVGGTVGPVPYDMNECKVRVEEHMAALELSVITKTTHDGRPMSDKDVKALSHISFTCTEAMDRPKNGSKFIQSPKSSAYKD